MEIGQIERYNLTHLRNKVEMWYCTFTMSYLSILYPKNNNLFRSMRVRERSSISTDFYIHFQLWLDRMETK